MDVPLEVFMKKNIPSIFFFSLSSILILNACSSGETYQDKMGRYTPRTFSKNIVPDIKVAHTTFNQKINSRSPASDNLAGKEDIDNSITNKKLYFLSLLDQYEMLKMYSDKTDAPKITICPNFHTGLINHYERYGNNLNKFSPKYYYNLTNMKDENYLSHHPELYLPLTKDSTNPRVVDILNQKSGLTNSDMGELIQEALNIHLEKTYFELSELCEYGSSDNYYIYENVSTHIKTSSFSPNEENVKILLKTTVFSNMAILNSLEKQNGKMGRSIASTAPNGNIYTNDLFKKLNITWAQDYFKDLKK